MSSSATQPLDEVVRQACAGQARPLYDFLTRRSALPGPRPNTRFATTAAQALLAAGPAGHALLLAMRNMDEIQAAPDTAHEFLPMVGVLALGLQAASVSDPNKLAQALSPLQTHVEDSRRHVRDVVIIALQEVLQAQAEVALEAMQSWTDGYLQAYSVLMALGEPAILQKLRTPDAALARLSEAFTLVEKAPRAHERSHGYRALLRALCQIPTRLGKRFSAATIDWLTEHAQTEVPELREALEENLMALRKAGLRSSLVEPAQQALDASAPAPRDPRSVVGPTRERGRKAKRRGPGR